MPCLPIGKNSRVTTKARVEVTTLWVPFMGLVNSARSTGFRHLLAEEGWYLITNGMDGDSLERSLRDILKFKSRSWYAERHISSWVSKSLGETDHRTRWPQCLTQER